jgi:hypothetical protein
VGKVTTGIECRSVSVSPPLHGGGLCRQMKLTRLRICWESEVKTLQRCLAPAREENSARSKPCSAVCCRILFGLHFRGMSMKPGGSCPKRNRTPGVSRLLRFASIYTSRLTWSGGFWSERLEPVLRATRMNGMGRTNRAGRQRGASYKQRVIRTLDRLGDLDLYFNDLRYCPRPTTPEQSLQSAVLEQAIHDLESARPEIAGGARSYVWSNDTSSPFSFVAICHSFEIDHRAAREALSGR